MCGKNIIEIETVDDIIICKYVVRYPYNKDFDIIVVFIPNDNNHTGRVLTVWLNKKKDKHFNLNKSRYNKPSLKN